MSELLFAVEDSKGKVFIMPSKTETCILAVIYCESYYTFEVQEESIDNKGNTIYPEKSIYVELEDANWLDLIALDGEERGKILDVKTLI